MFNKMNTKQKNFIENVLHTLDYNNVQQTKCYFIKNPDGPGKTYVYNAPISVSQV